VRFRRSYIGLYSRQQNLDHRSRSIDTVYLTVYLVSYRRSLPRFSLRVSFTFESFFRAQVTLIRDGEFEGVIERDFHGLSDVSFGRRVVLREIHHPSTIDDSAYAVRMFRRRRASVAHGLPCSPRKSS